MIPIRDTTPTQNAPIVNSTIIGFNIVIFVVQIAQGPDLNQFNYIYGLVPARYTVPQIKAYFTLGQQVLSFFPLCFCTEIFGICWEICGHCISSATMLKIISVI